MNDDAVKKVANILRTSEEVILELAKKMEKLTGKKDVFEKIVNENEENIKTKIKTLGLSPENLYANELFQTLVAKTRKEDQMLFKIFKEPEFSTTKGCQTLINSAQELTGKLEGFFLKKEKAVELLHLNPPRNILKVLGLRNVKELILKEELFDIFAALRFAEDPSWLNDIFFKPYQGLRKEDFEKRTIEVRVLPKHWLEVGKKFTGKKLHNISHLKELGIVFVIPYEEKFEGQVTELFTLVLHYLYEVSFYSGLFEKYSQEENFGQKLIQSLKGMVSSQALSNNKKCAWRIIQRYLAKDDPSDSRLFEPHVNPEVIHWRKAEKDLTSFGKRFAESDLEFFAEPDWVGDFFKTKDGRETLISFDLIDNVISLAKESTLGSKYLYHHQEALWNKIFREYMGEDSLEKLVIENLDKGMIVLGK